jgi:hypothetical protein
MRSLKLNKLKWFCGTPFAVPCALLILLLLFFSGCRSIDQSLKPVQADSHCLEKFRPVFKADWYNANVDVIGKHISGLLLFKAMPDSSLRLVFTNEVGVTFFDFEFGKRGEFKVHQIIDQMDKKPVITLLRKDFELIMMRGLTAESLKSYVKNNEILYALPGKKETDYFITDKECASLLRIEKASKRKKKVEVILTGRQQTSPDAVYLKHFTFDMQISLKKLER